MVVIDFKELLDAYEFAAAMADYDAVAVVCTQTGKLYVDPGSCEVDEDAEERPPDLDTNPRYLALPGKRDLDLGSRLALRFARDELPDAFDEVVDFFHHEGAYARFKNLLDRRGLLPRWYAYETERTEAVLREWCRDNGLDCG